MPNRTKWVIGHGLLRAATRATNVFFAGVTATSSVILHSWSLFGVSVAGYATLLAWDMSRLGFWQQLLRDLRTRPAVLPEPETFTEGAARQYVHRLHHARGELHRVTEGVGAALVERLAGPLETIPDVERRAVALVGRLEELSRYLSDKNLRAVRDEVGRLARAAGNASDPTLREEYDRARFAVHEELVALEEVTSARELMMARLETLIGSLEMFPCEIVRARVRELELVQHQPDEAAFDPRTLAAGPVLADLGLLVRRGERDAPESQIEPERAAPAAAPAVKASGGL